MPFEKGNKLQVPRTKPNKDKRRFKVKLEEMFENNADKIAGWLEELAEGKVDPENPKKFLVEPDPKEALNQLNRWAEYCYPKLARTENTHEVKDAGQWIEDFEKKAKEYDAKKKESEATE